MTNPDQSVQAMLAAREMPKRPHVMLQRWEQLLFLHWRQDADEIQRTLPPGLFVDTFEGDAWLAIVPFFMQGIRWRFTPAVPGISNFLEMNVRTYVHDGRGRHGVWFYSLDCNQPLAVWTARAFFHLPYHHARMSATVGDGWVDYICHRRNEESESSFRYAIKSSTHLAEPGTLEFFLAERYLLFSQSPGGIRCGRVHHAPYPLADAELEAWDSLALRQAGLVQPGRPPDHVMGSPGVDVRVYPLTI